MDGKVIDMKGYRKYSPPPRPVEECTDFGDRLQRIRDSLEKINRLFKELGEMTDD